MAFMFARVELHYPADGDYDKLHTYMHDAQFHRRMTSLGQTCDLPWAYYASDKYELSTAALTSVQNATRRVGKSASVVVSKATEVVFSGLRNCERS
jgi:hypothetical protein